MAYDNTPVGMNYGRGYSDTNPESVAGPVTVSNPDYTFVVDGTMTEFKSVLRSASASPCVTASLCVVSESGGVYTVEQLEDITAQVNIPKAVVGGIGKFSVAITGLSIPVRAGEFLAVYMDAEGGFYQHQAVNSYKTLFTTANAPVDGEVIALTTTAALNDIPMQATYTATSRLPFDDDNSAAGFGNGDLINIPSYTDKPFYVVAKGVQVPNGESLAVNIKFTNQANQFITDVETYTMNLTADTIADSVATSNSIVGQDGEKFDLHMYFDPASRREDLFYVNFQDGTGGLSVADYEHKSLNSRIVAQIPQDIQLNPIRWIEFVGGAGATVDSVVVCREPLLVIGDSFTGAYNATPALSQLGRVGAALVVPGVFEEDRYGILGGCSDGKVTSQSYSGLRTTAIRDRWNSTGNDMCNFRDVVVCLVNGPGVNDIAIIDETYTEISINSRALQIAGDVQRMAGDAGSELILQASTEAINDIILAEMIPYEQKTGQARTNGQDAQLLFNNAARYTSYKLQVPIAIVFDQYAALGFGYDGDDGLHPTTEGAAWLAAQMANVYENDISATASDVGIGSGGYRSRYS